MDGVQELAYTLADIKRGERTSAVSRLTRLVTNEALLGEKWLVAARFAQSLGEVTLAKNALSRYANMGSLDPQRQLIRAGILAEMGQINEGLQLIETFQQTVPYNVTLQHFIASARSQLGDVNGAIEIFRKLLRNWQGSGQSWVTFSALKSFFPDDTDFVNLKVAHESVAKTEQVSKASYFYALGKAQLDCENLSAALEAYTSGAEIMSTLNKFDVLAERRMVDALINSYSEETYSRLAYSNSDANSPIFVLGWPRSGTTLVEHIITAHSQVMGGGEIDLIRKATLEIKGTGSQFARGYEEQFQRPENAWDRISEIYFHLVEQRFGDNGRIVDKTLNNSRYLGLIGHIFPRSPIIWLKRDPLDSAWSCFRTCFSGNMPWSWSLTDIAEHFNNENKLFDHWKNLLGDKILVVPYEELVAAPELWTSKILTHCNLSDESLVSDFFKNSRAVTTSSSLQVRNPVHSQSVGLGGQFTKYLQPFIDSYIAS